MHSKLAPSSAHRWMNCPGCVALEAQFSDQPSVYTQEGTLAHKLAELKLNRLLGVQFSEFEFKKIFDNELYDPDMNSYTDDYVNYIKSIQEDGMIIVEKRVVMESVNPEIFGTADCIIAGGDHLQIVDFKYGRNVRVEVKNNEQLRLYAIGAYELLNVLYDFKRVTIHVVQPRMNNIDCEELSIDELLDWGKIAKNKANEALGDNAKTNAGSWCRFCKARSACKAYGASVMDSTVSLPDPNRLSLDEIATLLNRLEGVSRYYKDLQSYALSLTLKGNVIPGYKAVEGRSTRTWNNEKEAFKVAKSMGLSESDLYTKKPISLAQLEKKLGKKQFKALEGFVEKPKGKPTLVRDEDKRDAIDPIAYDFKDIDFDKLEY